MNLLLQPVFPARCRPDTLLSTVRETCFPECVELLTGGGGLFHHFQPFVAFSETLHEIPNRLAKTIKSPFTDMYMSLFEFCLRSHVDHKVLLEW